MVRAWKRRLSPRWSRVIGWTLLAVAGCAFYVAVEGWEKAVPLLLGAVIMDVALDMLILDVERATDDDD